MMMLRLSTPSGPVVCTPRTNTDVSLDPSLPLNMGDTRSFPLLPAPGGAQGCPAEKPLGELQFGFSPNAMRNGPCGRLMIERHLDAVAPIDHARAAEYARSERAQ